MPIKQSTLLALYGEIVFLRTAIAAVADRARNPGLPYDATEEILDLVELISRLDGAATICRHRAMNLMLDDENELDFDPTTGELRPAPTR